MAFSNIQSYVAIFGTLVKNSRSMATFLATFRNYSFYHIQAWKCYLHARLLRRLDIILKVKQKRWYKNGKIHREDGPAIIHSDGSEEWCYEGKKHRIGGKAWAENYFIHGRLFMKKEYEAHPLMIAYNIQKKVENIGLF